ncbi:glyceraldehyde dehydrogenase subunit alpha [Sulfuracidifex tepidarius]|uniref:Glyceraldehyde dehydrogenase large chain n=1 Tax=Sulfuracidifex tepidarius TaxID=1294262 RepID=A0A510E6V7_9CREN|nr:glyceraldehyde dehydrogenase subunit alpha [Sulfuracidifex tepidarius]BBG25487.1 Glyceraldehyde dehydrogenase large chain [Sulfuracidifex tepidarius]BBG28281.1 Glyceraldehyde dehydrogenase large chain [Sulfuracidifex tepidarius]
MYVGQRLKRKEDLKFLTGEGKYVDDLAFPGTLDIFILRSNVSHARLTKIDVRDALNFPGVEGVITGLNFKLDNRPRNFPMAKDEILYTGQPLAVIIAKDRYTAADAAELIQVDYEELPSVLDPETSLKNEIRAIEDKDNVGYKKVYSAGDPENAIKDSDVVIDEKIEISRVYPGAMEPRGILSVYQQGSLTVYASTQSPHYMRKFLLSVLGDKVNDIRVIQADTGGAFGSKLFPYAEDFITAYASIVTKRPVKWIATRSEDMKSTYHGRGQIHHVKAGAKKDGSITAIIDDLILDMGAASHSTYLADIAATMLPAAYKIANVKVNVYGVYTNKTPLDQYRGAGRPEATFVIERIMDILSDEVKMDPIDFRKKNLVTSLPYKNPLGINFESGDFISLLQKSEHVYREFERKAEELRMKGIRAGVGLSFYVEENNFGPWESASVRVRGDGKILVVIGAAPHGQGDGTAVAQIVADELGVPIEDVDVIWGDTAIIGEAFGTYGSRSLTLAGNAALLASRKVKERAKKLAAQFLKSDVQELEYTNGKVVNPKTGKQISLKEIASKVTENLGGPWVYKEEPRLESTAYFGMDDLTHPYGSHVALVAVDETGKPKVLDYYAVDDIGKVVNPLLAEGQVRGGVIQGWGESVMEEMVYDENGNLITGSFAEYGIPTSMETFNIKWDFVEVGMSSAPLPAKGIGEGATIGTPPAVVRALERAVGKRITSIPVKMDNIY